MTRDNYTLDIEKTGVLEKHFEVVNGIANMIFMAIRYISYATVTLFYYAVKFDMGELFGGQIGSMQQALNSTIFQPLFLLASGFSLFGVAGKIAKGNVTGGAAGVGKIILVWVLAMGVVLKSDAAFSAVTGITKSVSIDALAGVNDGAGMSGNIETFAAEAAGVLWVDLVHEPWKTAQFLHTDIGDSDDAVEKFLTEGDKEKRAALVEGFGDAACFNMSIGYERVGFLLIYQFLCIAKCLLYMAVAGALLLFQVLAVFYLLLAPVVLLLFLLAGYENILTAWLKKMLETQVMLLVVMLMLALLIRTDMFLMEKADEWGWFIVVIVQLLTGVGLFLNRGRIFELLGTVQRGVSMPAYAANRLRTGGNVTDIRKSAVRTGRQMKQGICTSVGKGYHAASRMIRMHAAAGKAQQTPLQTENRPYDSPPPRAGQESAASGTGKPAEGKAGGVPSGRRPTLAGMPAGTGMGRRILVWQDDGGKKGIGGKETEGQGSVKAKDTGSGSSSRRGERTPVRFRYAAAEAAGKGALRAFEAQPGKSPGTVQNGAERGSKRLQQGTEWVSGKKPEQGYGKPGQAGTDQGQGKRPAIRERAAEKSSPVRTAAGRPKERRGIKRSV